MTGYAIDQAKTLIREINNLRKGKVVKKGKNLGVMHTREVKNIKAVSYN